jgi:homoserine O-acetyltransferase
MKPDRIDTLSLDLPLRCGQTLRRARLVYAVWGQLNAARDNLVLFPTRFGGTHDNNAWLIGAGKALDPARFCIVVPNMLGNGLSSSPSTGEGGADFPAIDHADNVALQHIMVRQAFRDADIALAVGWSMGAQQAWRWAVEHPERVRRLACFCGTARTTPHNRVFLEGLLAALAADPAFAAGGVPTGGLRAAGRVYAGWAYSQPWLRREGWRETGHHSLDDWLARTWDVPYAARHAGDCAAMWRTWIAHDVADGGNLAAALGRITARTLVATASTDLYFTPADCAADAALVPGARYETIETDWGHMAGSGLSPTDSARIDALLAAHLEA